MKKVWFLLLACCTAGLFAGELVIAEKGKKTNYSIVRPDTTGDAALDNFLRIAGETLNKSIRQATGVFVPVIKESELKPGDKAIFIGATKSLKSAGIDATKFKTWEYTIFAKDGNVYLAGNDVPNRYKVSWPKHYGYFVLGSLKAATEFCERFGHTIFPLPDMLATVPADKVGIPDNYSFRTVPRNEFCTGRGQNVIYDVANNFLMGPWYGNYGGHSHDKAIPASMYKDHPEYFAMIKGKRNQPHPVRPQHCISNPEVQKLIYQELLDHADKGYTMVQLNQSDGYVPCQCENCVKMHNTKNYGEKLWIMHRAMAEKFMKDRPGKKLCIMAYGPTLKTPTSFRELPPNVVVDLAPYNEKVMADWKKMKVPGGFTVYLYNWGYYQLEGFTPKAGAKFLADQLKSFEKNNVRGIYRCGFGELFGLEGPYYYQYGKQLVNPDLDTTKLLQTYCKHTYGKAAGVMEKFFTLLDKRVSMDIARSDNWNDPGLLAGSSPAMHDNMRIIALRYPENVLIDMDKLLAQAEKLEPKSFPLELARMEFDYLQLTARAVNAFEKYRTSKNTADGEAMLRAIAARDAFIAKVPLLKNVTPPRPAIRNGVRLFGYPLMTELSDNGRLRAPLMAPLNHDAQWMLDNRILPAGRSMKVGSAPQLLVQRDFYRQNPEVKSKPVTFEIKADDKDLHVIFHFAGTDQKAIANDQIQIYFERNGRRIWLPGRARNGWTSSYERTTTNLQNKGMGDQYKSLGKSAGKIVAPAPGVEGTSAMISVPWTFLGGKPAPGEKCGLNIAQEGNGVSRIWEHNLYQKTWRNLRDETGTLEF